MGRFETLKPETQDMVEAMLPAIAAAFGVDQGDFKDIIPEDIRMRAWDCERRDHIKDQTEDEPRNWGVQFLKDLQAIARLNGNSLSEFQEALRARVSKHAKKHPWAQLNDIKAIKAKLDNPDISSDERDPDEYQSVISSSTDSYLQELVEADLPKGKKRRRADDFKPRIQSKPKKPTRLRRNDEAGWDRRGKHGNRQVRRPAEVDNDSDVPKPADHKRYKPTKSTRSLHTGDLPRPRRSKKRQYSEERSDSDAHPDFTNFEDIPRCAGTSLCPVPKCSGDSVQKESSKHSAEPMRHGGSSYHDSSFTSNIGIMQHEHFMDGVSLNRRSPYDDFGYMRSPYEDYSYTHHENSIVRRSATPVFNPMTRRSPKATDRNVIPAYPPWHNSSQPPGLSRPARGMSQRAGSLGESAGESVGASAEPEPNEQVQQAELEAWEADLALTRLQKELADAQATAVQKHAELRRLK